MYVYRIYPCIIRTFFGQNEHVKLGVRIIHGCALYTGNQKCLFQNDYKTQTKHHIHSNFF